jgi:hypothetical protein
LLQENRYGLLTKEQAHLLVRKAYSLQYDYGVWFRLGQAIMNLLPDEWYDYVINNEDFFHWKDNEKSLESFYKQCVEK